jgi:hypothetical protein
MYMSQKNALWSSVLINMLQCTNPVQHRVLTLRLNNQPGCSRDISKHSQQAAHQLWQHA